MAITAKFEADFSAFNQAVEQAVTKLSTFTQGSTQSTKAMEDLDRATTKTSATMTAGLATSTSKVESNFSRARTSLTQFDGILASVGIHMSPEIRALGELGDAAGKSAGQLGLVSTAGLVLGAGIAGWKIGRAIANFFDLDNAIGNATAKLLGWGDAQAAVTGARGDVLALATQRAGHAVTDLTDAMRINDEWFKKHQKSAEDAVKADEEVAKAMIELNAAGQGWQGTLETIDGETVNAIQYYLDAGVAQGVLAKAYALTDVQVKAVASSMAAAKDAAAAEKKDLDLLIDAYEKLHAVTGKEAAKIQADLLEKQAAQVKVVNDAILAELAAQTTLNAAMGRDAAGALQVQTSAAETLRIGMEHLHAGQVTGISQKAQEQVLTDAFTRSLYDEAVAIDKEFEALRRANDELAKKPALQQAAMSIAFNNPFGGSGGANASNTDPQVLAYLQQGYTINEALAIVGGYGQGILGHQGAAAAAQRQGGARAGGGSVSAGSSYLVGERGPELFTPGASGYISPNSGGTVVNNYITIVDTAENLAKRTADYITRSLKSSRTLRPA